MGADPFWDRGSLSRVSGGSPALGVARFLAALGLGGWRRQGASAAQPRQARATVPEGGVAGPRPRRRRRFEEVVWGAVGRVSATRMSPKSLHGRIHGVPDEGPPHL